VSSLRNIGEGLFDACFVAPSDGFNEIENPNAVFDFSLHPSVQRVVSFHIEGLQPASDYGRGLFREVIKKPKGGLDLEVACLAPTVERVAVKNALGRIVDEQGI